MFNLIKLVIKNSKAGNGTKTIREKIFSVLSFFIVFGTLSSVMVWVSYFLTFKLKFINQTNAFSNILLLFNFFVLFAESIFESLNSLYFSKDLKQFLTMPIKPWKLILAKIINIIKSEYMMEVLMLLIPMFVYGSFHHLNIVYFLYVIIVLLLLPIIPIFITSLIVAIIMALTHRIKNKNKVLYIVAILTILIVSILVGGYKQNTNNMERRADQFTEMILQANGLANNISDQFIFVRPTMYTLVNYNNIDGVKNLLLFVGETIAVSLVCLIVISSIYLKGATGTIISDGQGNSNQKNRRLILRDFKKKNRDLTYLGKEFKTLIRTPIFAIQCVIMPIIYPLVVYSIIMAFAYFSKYFEYNLLAELNNRFSNMQGLIVFIGVGQIFFMMNFTSIIAISRDGLNSKFMKFIPIDLAKQFLIKSRWGIIFNTIPSVLMSIFFYSITHNMINAILLFSILMLLNILGEKFKIIIDLIKPWLNWKTEYAMMKQNTNVFYELFYTLIILGVLFLLGKIINNLVMYLVTIIILLALFNIVLNIFINKKKQLLFSKIF